MSGNVHRAAQPRQQADRVTIRGFDGFDPADGSIDRVESG
jgi:hypothetical protein